MHSTGGHQDYVIFFYIWFLKMEYFDSTLLKLSNNNNKQLTTNNKPYSQAQACTNQAFLFLFVSFHFYQHFYVLSWRILNHIMASCTIYKCSTHFCHPIVREAEDYTVFHISHLHPEGRGDFQPDWHSSYLSIPGLSDPSGTRQHRAWAMWVGSALTLHCRFFWHSVSWDLKMVTVGVSAGTLSHPVPALG